MASQRQLAESKARVTNFQLHPRKNILYERENPEEKPGLTPERLQQAERAHRDAMRWLGNFHTFIIGFSEEQRPQIEAWINELKEQIERLKLGGQQ
jgi:hypothetical protein